MSYLPLSHVAANMMDIIAPIASGATIYFADKDVLKVTKLLTLIVKYYIIILGGGGGM